MSNLIVGDTAPNFTSKDQEGKEVSLSDFKGKKVALYFYPKDNTSGCTAQACNLKDNIISLQEAGLIVIGVSPDGEKSHQKFIAKYELPFSLIADQDHSVAEMYRVWKEKSMYGKKYMGIARTTFVIDENGLITKIIDKVKTTDHTAQILA